MLFGACEFSGRTRGRLTRSTAVDSNHEREQTANVPLNRVVAGQAEGLQRTRQG